MPKHTLARAPRRRRRRRTALRRRASDRYTVIVQRIILGSGAVGVIYGQAELLGEPWRHVLAIGCVAVLVVVAVWMKVT
jgi:preprotein translocase subunit SecY